MTAAHALELPLPAGREPEALAATLLVPADADAVYTFAHGAGAGMDHPFMVALAQALAARRIATLRFQFPFMQRGSRRPDAPAVAHDAVRAAAAECARRLPGLRLVAGGKSYGGRMTSQAHAERPLDGVGGLAFVGFPLHPAGKPGIERARHLASAPGPMLFLQGTRDELADLALLREAVAPLGPRATLKVVDDADHAFHVRAASGRKDPAVIEELADAMRAWIDGLPGP